jgi:hypothetical protein
MGCVIRFGGFRIPVAMDGEVIFLRPPLLYRCRPGDLIVFAPQPAAL